MPKDYQHCSLDAIQDIVSNRQYNTFIWPDEYWKDGKLYSPMPAGADPIEVEPLLIDAQTANCLMIVYDALSDNNKEKMKTWIERDRAHFGRIVEISWSAVSYK